MSASDKKLSHMISGKNIKVTLYAGLLAAMLIAPAHAGGISLGATRVIYMQGVRETTLSLANTSESNLYLIQSWITDAEGKKSSSFVLTPPLFTIKPKKENSLRIMYTGPKLPTDRETVFYLNSKAIPSVNKKDLQGNTLQIATQSVIKLFVRPQNLPSTSREAPKNLNCKVVSGKVTVKNPSPYYVTLVSFSVGGQKLPNTMISPLSSREINIPGHQTGTVSFQTVNDYGSNTPRQKCD